MEYVVLVDEKDRVLGTMEKIEAHKKGVLHRAFSVFLFNHKGEMLVQQRAASKYHSPLLWTNSCCSHPRENEKYKDGAERRIYEELGIHAKVTYKFDFIYKAKLDLGLYEHELDHVFVGNYEGEVPFNPDEVAAVKWVTTEWLIQDVKNNPEQYTAWFKIIFDQYLNQL